MTRRTADIIAALRGFIEYYGCDPGVPMSAVDEASEAADRLAELDKWLPRVMSAAANYDTRIGVYGSSDLPQWLIDLIPPEEQATMDERPSQSPRQVLARLDALRPPCPTCGGNGFLVLGPIGGHAYGNHESRCPDCTDGKMSHERAWKIVAAVFDDDTGDQIGLTPLDPQEHDWTEIHDAGIDAALDHLRGIR